MKQQTLQKGRPGLGMRRDALHERQSVADPVGLMRLRIDKPQYLATSSVVLYKTYELPLCPTIATVHALTRNKDTKAWLHAGHSLRCQPR